MACLRLRLLEGETPFSDFLDCMEGKAQNIHVDVTKPIKEYIKEIKLSVNCYYQEIKLFDSKSKKYVNNELSLEEQKTNLDIEDYSKPLYLKVRRSPRYRAKEALLLLNKMKEKELYSNLSSLRSNIVDDEEYMSEFIKQGGLTSVLMAISSPNLSSKTVRKGFSVVTAMAKIKISFELLQKSLDGLLALVKLICTSDVKKDALLLFSTLIELSQDSGFILSCLLADSESLKIFASLVALLNFGFYGDEFILLSTINKLLEKAPTKDLFFSTVKALEKNRFNEICEKKSKKDAKMNIFYQQYTELIRNAETSADRFV
jgi:hypothetical protein